LDGVRLRASILLNMPDFRNVFERVQNQVIIGNAHLSLWKRLGKRISGLNNIVANTAPTFLGMTLDAHLCAAFLYAARVFDTHHDALTIHTILRKAGHEMGTLSPKTQKVVRGNLSSAKTKLLALQAIVDSVRTRRDKVLAHLDLKVITHPDEVTRESQISVKELENLFRAAWEILNEISGSFWEITSILDLVDIDDYERPMSLIEKAKKIEREEYEAEFGPLPD